MSNNHEESRRILTLAIQAGGYSKRMGQNKALLPFGGRRLIEYIAERGKLLTTDLFITTNQPQDFQFIDLPLVSDQLTQRGALIGMYTALSFAQRPLVAVIGCDMPFFSLSLLEYQAKILEKSDFDAVIPLSVNGLEPLHGVYRRERCLAAIKTALEMNIYSLHGWIKLLKIYEVVEDQIRLFDPELRAFTNLNTIEEYQRAADLLEQDQTIGDIGYQ